MKKNVIKVCEINNNIKRIFNNQPLTKPLSVLKGYSNFKKKYKKAWDLKYEEEIKAERREYSKRPEVRKKMKKYIKKYNKEYLQKPEVKLKRKEYHKEYLQKPEVKVRIKKYKKKYYEDNKDKINIHDKQRRKTDLNYMVTKNLRSRFYKALKHYSETGKIMTSKKYGIDIKAIIKHLGSKPNDGKVYEVDHIIPLCMFNHNNPKQIKKAWVPENHQWLPKEINRWKGDRLIKPLTEEQKEKLLKELQKK